MREALRGTPDGEAEAIRRQILSRPEPTAALSGPQRPSAALSGHQLTQSS